MVTVRGLDPLLTLPVKPANRKPLLGVAVTVTTEPALYQHPKGQLGVTVPPEVAVVVSWYCIGVKLAVSVIALFMVATRGFDPLLTLPVKPLRSEERRVGKERIS